MPFACGGCGKFISLADAAKCTKCRTPFHRACVGLSASGAVHSQWQCPDCRKNIIRDNKAETPVRGRSCGQDDAGERQESATGDVRGEAVDGSHGTHDMQSTLTLLVYEVRSLRAEIGEIKGELLGLKTSITACQTRMDILESRLGDLETQAKERPPSASTSSTDQIVAQLKQEQNDRDQELLANDLLITNIPKSQSENPTHLVQLVATRMGVQMDGNDIVYAERIGRRLAAPKASPKADGSEVTVSPRPRALVVRFVRREPRNALLSSARVRREATTEGLGVAEPTTRFFINERLTRTNQLLFRRAREAAERHGWRYVWTRHGHVLARRRSGEPSHRIAVDGDIPKIVRQYEE